MVDMNLALLVWVQLVSYEWSFFNIAMRANKVKPLRMTILLSIDRFMFLWSRNNIVPFIFTYDLDLAGYVYVTL